MTPATPHEPPRLRVRSVARRAPLALALLCVAIGACATSGCGKAAPGRPLALPANSALPASRASHVVVIVLENADYSEVIGNPAAPYANALARRYGLMTDSYAIAHPSLPNYLALTSGSTHGIESDCTSCSVPGPSIASQLETAGISWRAYLEGVSHPCFRGASTGGGYAKKHDPFAYYRDLAGSPARCAHLVGFGALQADLRAGTLPTYAWITPNLCDDGHDCGVAGADAFLARTVPALLRELGPRGFLVLTWDEGSSNDGCCAVATGGHVATIVAGPQVRPGARASGPIDHYGVLGSIEEALGLPPLAGSRDPRSGRLTALFTRPPLLR